ncbi:MAG: deoxyhypusine synthase family protein [Deltaproteobacteria bacterium]|nr:deoxyhypusine synthase family protein [Deltaproteobacteria bacterium]
MENNIKNNIRQPIEISKKDFHKKLLEIKNQSFQSRALGEVYEVWREMILSPRNMIFLGLSGSLSSAGYWPLVCYLIKNRFIDVLVSTGANISEDIYEAMGHKYYKVDPWFVDDKKLLKQKLDRFYDHAADEYDYRKLEDLIAAFFRELNAKLKEPTVFSTSQFLYQFGLWLKKKNIWSILTYAAHHKVPVFSPALVDSGFGEAYIRAFNGDSRTKRNLIIEQFFDQEEILEIAEWGRKNKYEKSAGYIGGGVPKDFIQLVAVSQALKDWSEKVYPFKYAFQITTDSPQWGGLSGCGVMTEPISWGKEVSSGYNDQVFCDATIALDFIAQGFVDSKIKRRHKPNLSWFFERFKGLFLSWDKY